MVSLSSFMGGAAGGTAVNIVIRGIDDFSGTFKSAKDGIGGLSIASKAMSVGLLAAGTAMTAYGFSAIKAAAANEDIESSFKSLSRNSDDFLESLNRATEGTVSNFELMQTANKALMLGVKQDNIADMFKYAAVIGESQGKSVVESINLISESIGRVNEKGLTQLGITVDLEVAKTAYAKSINKTVAELTKEEERSVLLGLAMDEMKGKFEQLGGTLGDDLGTEFDKLNKKLNDAKVEIGNELLPAISDLMASLSDTGAIEIFATATSQAIRDFAQGLRNIAYMQTEFNNTLSKSPAEVIGNIFKKEETDWGKSIVQSIEQYGKVKDTVDGVELATDATDMHTESIYTNESAVLELITAEQLYKEETEKLTMAKSAGTMSDVAYAMQQANLNDKLKLAREEAEKTIPQFDSLSSSIRNLLNMSGSKASGGKSWSSGAAYTGPIYNAGTWNIGGEKVKISSGGKVNDFISRPGMSVQEFSPDDTIIGVKNPSALNGKNIIVNIGNLTGVDEDQITEMLQRKLRSLIMT